MPGPVLGYPQALIYGLIQGLTEFLPVSSSGHLKLAHLAGLGAIPSELETPFDVLLHAATLIAIIVAFRREILATCHWRPRLWAMILVAAMPAGIAGLVAGDLIERAGAYLWLIGACYVWTALLLLVAERRARPTATDMPDPVRSNAADDLDTITWRAALSVGAFQILALLPGVSRSGSTVAGGLIGGLRPNPAVGFAFLVGLPLIAGAAAKDAIDGGFAALHASVGTGPLALAFAAALVSGLAAIAALKLVVRKGGLRWFALYCALVATACFVAEAAS